MMTLLKFEPTRKTDSGLIAKLCMFGLALFVCGYFVAPLIVSYDYLAVGEGDPVRHARYPGRVESVNDRGEATVVTFDNKKVTVPVEELIEQ
jgi:hypothetical protein